MLLLAVCGCRGIAIGNGKQQRKALDRSIDEQTESESVSDLKYEITNAF